MKANAVDIRDMVLLTLAVVLAAALVPLVPPLGVPLAAFALATLAYRFREGTAWIAAALAIGAMAVLFWPSWALALLAVAPIVITAGPVAAKLLRRRPALVVAALVAVVVVVVNFAVIAVGAAVAGKSLFAYIDAEMASSTAEFAKLLASASQGAQTASTQAAVPDAATLRTEAFMVLPGFIVVMAMVTGLLATAATSLAGRRAAAVVNRLPKLTTLDISSYALVPIIAGLVALALQTFVHGTFGLVLGIIGGNLLVVGIPMLTIQGLGILLFWLQRWEIPRGARIALAAAACVLEPFVPLMTLAGLMDTWLNLRKLPRSGDEAEPQAEERRY